MGWYNIYRCKICHYVCQLSVNSGWTEDDYRCISCHKGTMSFINSEYYQR